MYKICRALLLASMASLALAFSVAVQAQTAAHPVVAADPLALLPASDVVMVIDHSRIWNEAIPRFLGNNTAPLAKLTAQMDEAKAKLGFDLRSISRIAIGVRFVNPETVVVNKMEKKDIAIVIIMQGDFDANKFLEFAHSEAKGRGHEEQRGGQTIYYLDEGPKDGRARLDIERQSLALLDANTVALGDLVHVRATVDAKNGTGGLSPELFALVTRNSNALVSLAGNVPPQMAASILPKEQTGESEMDKALGKFFDAVASIKQLHFSLGLTAVGVESVLGARFASAEQAESLSDMLLGARQQYAVFIDDKTARDSINNMQITAQGDLVELRSEIPQALITEILEKAGKEQPKATAPSTSSAATVTTKTTSATTATKATAPTPKKKRRSTRRKRT